MMRLVVCLCLLLVARAAWGGDFSRRVVLVIWDGMRPDFINASNTPNLFKLAERGTFFEQHHSVYPSATEVNCAAISTGCYPENDGIVSNSEFRPGIDPHKAVHVEALEAVREGDKLAKGHYLRAKTVAEIVRAHGGLTAVAGAKPVILLADRSTRESADRGANIVFGTGLPESLTAKLLSQYGPFPGETATNLTRNDWTTSALLDPLWAGEIPQFTFLWMNQPDLSQHLNAPGAPKVLAAIHNADANLGRLIATLKERGLLESTDILVASDHGCSTCTSQNDVAGILQQGGFKAARAFKGQPESEEAMVVSNSGSSLVYLPVSNLALIARIVRFLQHQKFTGVLFTKEKLPGTFTLKEGHLDGPGAPDIFISFRWSEAKNQYGVAGSITTDASSYPAGQGLHVSLSKYDMHATLVAAGPDFKSGYRNQLATGNVDLAPTVLSILKIKPPAKQDGRILWEAMRENKSTSVRFNGRREVREAVLESGKWKQYLKVAEVNGVTYFDEGNGEDQTEKEP